PSMVTRSAPWGTLMLNSTPKLLLGDRACTPPASCRLAPLPPCPAAMAPLLTTKDMRGGAGRAPHRLCLFGFHAAWIGVAVLVLGGGLLGCSPQNPISGPAAGSLTRSV